MSNAKTLRQFVSCALFALSSILSAQEFEIKTFSSGDGLCADFCFHAYQDPLGYLWIGTDGGLSRFNGNAFTNYGYADGLPDVRIDAIFTDHTKRLWIGTRRGIAEFSGNQCISYPISDSLEITFVFGFVETPNHEILALTNAGVYGLDDSIWIKRRYYPGYDDRACRQLISTEEGMYFNYGDLVVFQDRDGTYSVVAPHKDSRTYYLNMTQAQKQIYISTIEGMYLINGTNYKPIQGPAAKLRGFFMYLIDSQDRCWIGTPEFGLQLCEQTELSTLKTVYDVPDKKMISKIIEDRDGTIWVASDPGLIRVREQPYRKYPIPGTDSANIVGVFLSELTQRLTLHNVSTRMMSFDGETFRPEYLKWESEEKEFFIFNQTFDEEVALWCDLLSLDLVKIEGQTIYGQQNTYAHLGDEVFDVIFDNHRNRIIVAMITQDMPCILGEDNMFRKMETTGVHNIPGHIDELHQCIDNTLLVSTAGGIIYSIDTNDHCKMQLNLFQGKGHAAQFFNDISNGVWIVFPGRGMRRYIMEGDSLSLAESINKKNGLDSDLVFDMCFDKSGQLWILTEKDVAVFRFDTQLGHYAKALLFSTANLDLTVYGRNRMVQDTSGKIWIASDDEMLCFDPALITLRPQIVPSIQIESILINHSKADLVSYADTLEGIFQLPKNLRLPHGQNTIDIQYRGIAVSGIEGVQYSYQLIPIDNVWSPPAAGNSVSFVQLPPGKYTFNVRAQLTENVWSKVATLSFEIRKPFWETWWFMTAAVLAVVFLMTTAFKYRLRSVRNKAELHDQLRNLESKALSAQMNPHFIHNALNSIQSLIVNSQSQMASQYVNKFARLLRHVMESGDKSLIALDQELTALRLYIDLERLRMDMEFTYMEEISEDINSRYVQIPPLLLQPFIENALWHGLSRKEGEKILQLTITDEGDWILCKITDNGIGREAASAQSGTFPMGSLSKATSITRARLINFNRQPDLEPISTTDVIQNDKSAGTEVLIHIRKQANIV